VLYASFDENRRKQELNRNLKLNNKMKKIIFCSFIDISILSCKKDNAENAKQTKTTTEQISFYKDLLINEVTKNLKKEFPKELSKYSENVIRKIATYQTENSFFSEKNLNDTIYLGNKSVITYKRQLELVDSLYNNKKDISEELYALFLDGHEAQLKEISFNDNIISMFWSPMSNGPSSQNQKLILTDNDVIDLGNGLKQLTKSESEKLVNFVKAKGFKNYTFYSEPSRNEVSISKDKDENYAIEFSEYDEDDAGCCPTLNITFKTKDFKTILENSIKVEKQIN
jgi:hypothetical protein